MQCAWQKMFLLRFSVQVVDERLAQGLWNAGLLSTQAGTIGRLCGNLLLSACARVTGACLLCPTTLQQTLYS